MYDNPAIMQLWHSLRCFQLAWCYRGLSRDPEKERSTPLRIKLTSVLVTDQEKALSSIRGFKVSLRRLTCHR